MKNDFSILSFYLKRKIINKIFGLSLCIFFNTISFSQNWNWARGGKGGGYEIGNSVSADKLGNVFVTGTFSGSTITFGNFTLTNSDSSDVYIVKYNSLGNVLWAKSAGGNAANGDNEGYSVSTDSIGNVFLTGYFNSSSMYSVSQK